MTTEPAVRTFHGSVTNGSTPRRPNVLLITADQLRWDAVGAYGNDIVQTPHLDRIAIEGVRFQRAYVANPFCMPARASMLTGRWPHAHGLWDNGVRLPYETVTLATVLSAQGYHTGIVGKGHLDLHNVPGSLDSYEGWADQRRANWTGPYYGFQEAQLTCGHNKAAGHYGAWLYREHPQVVPLLEMDRATEPPIGGAWKSALPVELHSSTWIGDRSVEFIKRHAQSGTPFFLWASFPDPHPPFCPPQPYADMYDPQEMPLPLRRRGETADKPPHFQGESDGLDTGFRPYGHGSIAKENRSDFEDQVQKAYYYGMTTLVDDNVGRMLAALEEAGQLDDTVVIYMSDHGEMLGDHWLDGKGPWHYDGCARIPVMVRYPKRLAAGHVVEEFASQCDLAPTICELTGTPYTTWPPLTEAYADGNLAQPGALPDVQGISLVAALRGEAPARPHVLMEYEWRWVPGLHQKTLRTPGWRISVYAGRPYGELYNLREDPDEFVNRWGDPAYRGTRLELTELLLQEVLRTEGRLPPRLAPN